MPLITNPKVVFLAVILAMILGLIATPTANADSHLPDCKTDSECLLQLSYIWRKITAAELQAMIDAGADVNATDYKGETPLHEAARYGNAEVIAVLLKAGADVNARDGDGNDPLDFARKHSHTKVISILEKASGKTIAQLQEGKIAAKKRQYERKEFSADGLVQYKFDYTTPCRISRVCQVIEAKAIHGCPRSLYMSLLLFDSQKRNIGWANAVAHGLRKGESALLEFSIIEKNVASYRVDEINCNQ